MARPKKEVTELTVKARPFEMYANAGSAKITLHGNEIWKHEANRPKTPQAMMALAHKQMLKYYGAAEKATTKSELSGT